MGADAYDLQRFVDAQEGVIDLALAELRAGRKRTHWMWFVFPQLRGLGRSPTAAFYGLASADEARAYLDHHLLGPRLTASVAAVQTCPASSCAALFGSPDDMKFRASMTLFAHTDPSGPWAAALTRWCGGRKDEGTLELLGSGAGHGV